MMKRIVLFAMLLLCAGCQSIRWGEHSTEDLKDLAATKGAESHCWPAFKPDRNLQDPLWTP
jgi:hypothetical protein